MRTPILAVDSVILFEDGVVLIKRKNPPFQGWYALPGGFVEIGETTEEAVVRESKEEAGLQISLVGLVGVYSDPDRDPRGHVVSVCYFSRGSGQIISGSDAKSAEVFPLDKLPNLAFDHHQMIKDALSLFCSNSSQPLSDKHDNSLRAQTPKVITRDMPLRIDDIKEEFLFRRNQMAEIRELIEKYALQNAVKYRAAPNSGAVMGKLMGEHPELRPRAKEIGPEVVAVLDQVAKMSPVEWQKRLETIAPELIAELSEHKEPSKGLPELEGVEGGVVMRFAPNPNGPPTLGSARGIVINSEYVKKYGGKFLIRFDDTDPVKKRPMTEAYGWYLEDCAWLGAKPDQVVIASERLHLYYEIAEELIRRGGAYVCKCEQHTFKEHKDAGIACVHRDRSPEENMDLWKKMLDGTLTKGQAVLRIKTDMSHKDPAIRDWPAFRIITANHPHVGAKYRVWPLLDFESAVEDHLLGMTHILRGKDLADSESRQKYLYEYMSWEYPRVIHWGKIKIHQFGSFSTSKLKKAIEAGEYSGWDDPRVPTVRAMRCRGIKPEALRKFMVELGVGETDISISMDTIYAENRKLIDPEANRYFFVWDPVLLEIDGEVPKAAKAPLHPTIDRGYREIPTGNNVFVCRSDLDNLKPGDRLRLKDFCNVELVGKEPARAHFIDADPETARKNKLRIIHWAPRESLQVMVMKPDGTDTGVGEAGIANELDRVVQFERYGFVRINRLGEPIVAYYAHR